jgi:hypothetical protein
MSGSWRRCRTRPQMAQQSTARAGIDYALLAVTSVAGDTKDETVSLMREAIKANLAGIVEDGDPIPAPSGPGVYVEEHAAAA